jgi:NADPH2:quinone reductase
MRAVQIVTLDGPDSLVVTDVPEPSDPDKVIVDVHFAGVSFPELLMSRGDYQIKPDPPFIPGSECAGVVRSAPAGAPVSAGDRVAAFALVGGWAETVAVEIHQALPLPDSVSFEEGAGSVMNPLTAHFALTRRGRLVPGETVLVHGAAGGVGVATLALAKALGAHTIAVVSSAEKGDVARRAGADDVVLLDGWLGAVKEITGGRGVDLLVDPVGGDRFADSVRAVAMEGRLLVVGFAGREIPTVAANRLLLKNIDVVGVNWGGFLFGHGDYYLEQWDEMAPLFASGAVPLVTGPSFPLEQAAEALHLLDDRGATGKVTLRVR